MATIHRMNKQNKNGIQDFRVYLSKRTKNAKARIEAFELPDGTIIKNKKHKTDFSWLKEQVANRITVFENYLPIFNATFFFAKYEDERIKIEIGEIIPVHAEEERMIG